MGGILWGVVVVNKVTGVSGVIAALQDDALLVPMMLDILLTQLHTCEEPLKRSRGTNSRVAIAQRIRP